MQNRVQMQISIFFFFLIGWAAPHFGQDVQTVLTPENANEARLNALQQPEQLMDSLGITKGMVVAEIGAGRGRMVVQLAVRVGESGKIFAEDIDAGALKHLEARCKKWDLKNVQTVLGDVVDPKLPEGELDMIFMISTYHHLADPVTLMRKARAALKPGGRLAIGEWFPTHAYPRSGTPPKKVKAQMKKAGYELERMETFLEQNRLYIYVFRPAKSGIQLK
jgi:ubiquinone/menaquinone biosynthesis C-methylase UbiE